MINIKKTFLELIASYIVIRVISFASVTENNVVITAMAEDVNAKIAGVTDTTEILVEYAIFLQIAS